MARTTSLEGVVFASEGDRVNPDDDTRSVADQLTMAGGNIDAQGPFSTHFNYVDHRQDAMINLIEQQGILEWSPLTSYTEGAFCKVGRTLYQLAVGGDGSQDPSTDNGSNWEPAEFGGGGIGVTQVATEEQTLAEAQVQVVLEEATTTGMALYIEGVRDFGFTVNSYKMFTLDQPYPAGTKIWVVSVLVSGDASGIEVTSSGGATRTASEWVTGQAYEYTTVADMRADENLTKGSYVRTTMYSENGVRGGNTYLIVGAGTGVDDGGRYIDLEGSGLQAMGLFPNGINVQQFGATPDNSNSDTAFENAAIYAEPLGYNNTSVFVDVPNGAYFISRDMPEAHWNLEAGVVINGLGGVPPTGEFDASRLKGKIYRWNSVSGSRSRYIGDPNMTIQRLTGKSYSAAVCGYSQNGTGGLAGTVYTKVGRDTRGASSALKLCAFNNDDELGNIGWGAYIEGVKGAGAEGATFNVESTSFNFGDYEAWTPYGQYDSPGTSTGANWNLYLTTGGTQNGEQTSTWSTAAIGFKGNEGSKFGRGLVFVGDCLGTGEIVAAKRFYSYTWYHDAGGNVENQVAKISEIGGGNNGNLGFSLWDDSVSALQTYVMAPYIFRSGADNTASLGSGSFRWSEVYAGTGSINTSDERAKQQIDDLSEAELRVGSRLRIRKFKFNDAVEVKGESARLHFGFIAQEVIEAFESEGLDAFKYGCVCYDSWGAEDEVLDTEGRTMKPAIAAGDLYSVRYDECYALMMAAKTEGDK